MTPADPIIAEVTASFAAEEFLGGKPGVEPNPLIIAVGTIAEKAVRSPLLHQRLEVPPDGQSVKIFREEALSASENELPGVEQQTSSSNAHTSPSRTS